MFGPAWIKNLPHAYHVMSPPAAVAIATSLFTLLCPVQEFYNDIPNGRCAAALGIAQVVHHPALFPEGPTNVIAGRTASQGMATLHHLSPVETEALFRAQLLSIGEK